MENIEKCELWQADCLEIMKKMPDKSVDFLITDAPFGMSGEEKIEDVQTAVTNGSEDTNTGKNSNEKPKNNFCRVCGEKLPDNSNFCSKCGAEVLNQYENGD